jgi:signal transduction histidine kinase
MGVEFDRNEIHGEGLVGYFRGQEAERRRVSQELHDSTGQHLVALRLYLSRLRRDAGIAPAGLLDAMSETLQAIDQEIRTISFLHCSELAEGDLALAFRRLADGFAQRTGIAVRVEVDAIPAGIPNVIGCGLYRIAQEALTNILRHSHASHASVSLSADARSLCLTIDDNGLGISPGALEAKSGVGLWSMRQRARQLGGQFAIRRLREGTRVQATIPADQAFFAGEKDQRHAAAHLGGLVATNYPGRRNACQNSKAGREKELT